jgi:4,5-DOPA dioxygenase extradiol
MVDFENKKRFDWAYEFDEKIAGFISKGDHKSVIEYEKLGPVARMAVPTNDHYLPLLYTLGLQDKKDSVHYFNDTMDAGSVSMRSILLN